MGLPVGAISGGAGGGVRVLGCDAGRELGPERGPLGELGGQQLRIGERLLRRPGQTRALCVCAGRVDAVFGKEHLPDCRHVQGRACADDLHDPHHLSVRAYAFDIDDLIALPDAQVDGLAQIVVQALHEGQGLLAHVQPGLHQIAELQQADAQPIGARLDPIDEPVFDHDRENPVGRRGMQVRVARQLLEVGRFRLSGQRLHQTHHAVDDLNGRFRLLRGHCFDDLA